MSNSKVLLALLGGIAVGAIAGILLAPDKGSNTRNALRNMASDLGDALEDSLHEALDKVKDKYADVVQEGEHIVENVAEKVQHAGKDVRTKFS